MGKIPERRDYDREGIVFRVSLEHAEVRIP